MSRTALRHLVICAATVGCLVAVPAAQANGRTSHFYGSTITGSAVSTARGYPAPGGTAVLAGTWTTNRFGAGAVVDYITMTGHPSANTFTFKGSEIGFVAQGTFRDTFTGKATIQPDGTQTLVTDGRFVGGTGKYRGATGRYAFTGSTTAGSSVVVGHSIGTIWY
jgi:hypothetical protein